MMPFQLSVWREGHFHYRQLRLATWVRLWEDLQPEVEHLTGIAGLKIIQAVIEDENKPAGGATASSGGRLGVPALGQQPVT